MAPDKRGSNGGRRVKIYTLTPAGRRRLRQETAAWQQAAGIVARFLAVDEHWP